MVDERAVRTAIVGELEAVSLTSAAMDVGMKAVFGVGSVASVITAIRATLINAKALGAYGAFWNFFDAIGGYVAAAEKLKKLPSAKRNLLFKKIDIINDLTQSTQLIGLTVPSVLVLAGVKGAMLAGFAGPAAAVSFAVCMWGALGVSIYNLNTAIKKSDPLYLVEDRLEKYQIVKERQKELTDLLALWDPNTKNFKDLDDLYEDKEDKSALEHFKKIIQTEKGKTAIEAEIKGMDKQMARLQKQAEIVYLRAKNQFDEEYRKAPEMARRFKEIADLKVGAPERNVSAFVAEKKELGEKLLRLDTQKHGLAALETKFQNFDLQVPKRDLTQKEQDYADYLIYKQEQKVKQNKVSVVAWSFAAVGMTLLAVGVFVPNPVLLGFGAALAFVGAVIKGVEIYQKYKTNKDLIKPHFEKVKAQILTDETAKDLGIELEDKLYFAGEATKARDEAIQRELAFDIFQEKSDVEISKKQFMDHLDNLKKNKPRDYNKILDKALTLTCEQIILEKGYEKDAKLIPEKDVTFAIESLLLKEVKKHEADKINWQSSTSTFFKGKSKAKAQEKDQAKAPAAGQTDDEPSWVRKPPNK